MPMETGHGVHTRHKERLCIVMACEDLSEAVRVGQAISQLNTGTLVTYRKAQDVLANYPAGRVALIILASSDDPQLVGKTLAWMKRRWPQCAITVIGDEGSGPLELAARTGGATYLTRPVSPDQWAAIVHHALKGDGQVVTEV